jgi:DNA-binding transcriptional LysR family regulator
MKSASLRQLRAFAAVARHQSFARAAAELNLTASAVSLQIKDLEKAVGLSLFGRSGRGTSLTPAGELLLVDVNRALAALQDASDTLTRLRGAETGVVSLAIVSNANYFMPALLARFQVAHPGVELRLSVGNRAQVIRQLEAGEAEIAIMGSPPADLETESDQLAQQPLGILAPSGDPLAECRAIPAAALTGREFLVRESGSGTRAAMDEYFQRAGIRPRRILELTSNDTIKQSVIAGLGLGFISFHTAGAEIRRGELVALDVLGLPLLRSWNVVHLRNRPLPQAAAVVRAFITDAGADQIAQLFLGVDLRLPGNAVATDDIE